MTSSKAFWELLLCEVAENIAKKALKILVGGMHMLNKPNSNTDMTFQCRARED